MKAAMPVEHKVTTSSLLSALAWICLAAGVLIFSYSGRLAGGPVSHHMLAHIALMNLAAPSMAFFGVMHGLRFLHRPRPTIWAAALTQLFLFLFWHAPPGIAEGTAAMLAMHVSLAASALWFWSEIFRWGRERPWMAVAALAVTGKIICLVAALYVFSPRALYTAAAAAPLADQHLAGILMLAACPLAYLGAALVITVTAFDHGAAKSSAASGDAA